MQRGEVWWVDFNTSIGGEIHKTRPALIISNDMSNKVMNRVQVIPLTSQLSACYPCEAYVEINGKMSKAMADQLTTVSKLRLKKKMAQVSIDDMKHVENVIKLQLGL